MVKSNWRRERKRRIVGDIPKYDMKEEEKKQKELTDFENGTE